MLASLKDGNTEIQRSVRDVTIISMDADYRRRCAIDGYRRCTSAMQLGRWRIAYQAFRRTLPFLEQEYADQPAALEIFHQMLQALELRLGSEDEPPSED